MYVCLRPPSVYVCMSQTAKHVCMYVSNIHTYTLMSQTYIHTYTLRFFCKIKSSACMDLFKNAQPVMKTKHTYMLNFLRNSCFRRLLSMYVCSKSLCLSWKTLNQGSQKLSTTVFRLIMYVCLKKVQNPSACHAFCNSDSTRLTEPQRFFKFSKRYSARYYINTSILTSRSSH